MKPIPLSAGDADDRAPLDARPASVRRPAAHSEERSRRRSRSACRPRARRRRRRPPAARRPSPSPVAAKKTPALASAKSGQHHVARPRVQARPRAARGPCGRRRAEPGSVARARRPRSSRATPDSSDRHRRTTSADRDERRAALAARRSAAHRRPTTRPGRRSRRRASRSRDDRRICDRDHADRDHVVDDARCVEQEELHARCRRGRRAASRTPIANAASVAIGIAPPAARPRRRRAIARKISGERDDAAERRDHRQGRGAPARAARR